MMRYLYSFCIISQFVFANCGDYFAHKRPFLALDATRRMWVAWTVKGDSIIFEVHAKTTGYVGFGLSHNGAMRGSDIVIGWVKEGKAFLEVSNVFTSFVIYHSSGYILILLCC